MRGRIQRSDRINERCGLTADQKSGMIKASDAIGRDDAFGLSRFISAQDSVYDRVLEELKSGRKRSHWMWYIFPQVDGLGYSATSKHYAIKSMEEARAYLNHPVLGSRLLECADAVMAIDGVRGGSFSAPRDFTMTAVLIRHPRGDLLRDAGYGRGVAAHARTLPWLMRALSTWSAGAPAADQLQRAGYDLARLA